MTGKKSDLHSQVRQLGILTTVPVILLAGPAVGFFIGGWIDRKAHSYPWVTFIFTVLGFVAAAREITRLLQEISKDEEKK